MKATSITSLASTYFRSRCAASGIIVSPITKTRYLISVKGHKPLHCKLHASCGTHFKTQKKDCVDPKSIIVYVWDADIDPSCYIMTVSEAMAVLGPNAIKTKSWTEHGYYSWSSATGIPKKRKAKMETFYKERWSWLLNNLGAL